MQKKKNNLHSIPVEMQATLDRERERQMQSRCERLEKNLEFVGKKMEAEFVKTESDKELIEDFTTNSDELINPIQRGDDGEIIPQNI